MTPIAVLFPLIGVLIGCSAYVHEPPPAMTGADRAVAAGTAAPESLATKVEEGEVGEVAAARAFLDEARFLLEDGERSQLRGEYATTEYYVKEAQQVLLEVDALLPTRTRLESTPPSSEALAVMHEAMLSLRLEFERLWTRSNALYDRVLPNLDLLNASSAPSQVEETMDLEAMNAALETSVEPTPGSWQEIRDLLRQMETEGEIGLDMEFDGYPESAWKQVYWSIQYYMGRGRRNFLVWLERSGRYRGLVEGILEEEGLPRDMVFLCMIESGFSPRAFSRVQATGPWQFMYYTAPKFGLKTYRSDTYIDERRDYEKSTRAASAYLTQLYDEFQSWPLAMAAYNSGEGRVRSALRWANRYRKGDDFWAIYPQLPRETKNYVPYYLAALAITKNPARFGFADVAYQPPFEDSYETVHIPGPLLLKYVAEVVGTTETVIRELNAEILNHGVTPEGGYDLRIPKGTSDAFISAIERLPLEGRKSFLQHTIVRGETGSVIAGKYGVPWSQIRAENGIRDDRNLQPGQVLRIPKVEDSRYLTSAEVASLTATPSVVPAGTPLRVRVRSGDTISGLATRYGVTWVQIRQWNNLRGNTIYIGQSLTLYPRRNRVVRTAAVNTASLPSDGVYTVGRNDTLWDISLRFGITVNNLKTWNGLRGNTIYPGQKLIVTRAAAEAAGVAGSGGY